MVKLICWSRRNAGALVIFTAMLLAVAAIASVAYSVAMNPCEIVQPRQLVGGHISTDGGFFAAETAYRLRYKGRHAHTGKECTVSVRTTEAEYERRVYGRKESDGHG